MALPLFDGLLIPDPSTLDVVVEEDHRLLEDGNLHRREVTIPDCGVPSPVKKRKVSDPIDPVVVVVPSSGGGCRSLR